MVFSIVKENLATANRIETDPEFAYLGLTAKKIKNLLKEGFIKEYASSEDHYSLYSPQEIMDYLDIERSMETDFLLLRDFYEFIGGDRASIKQVLIDGFIKLSNKLEINIVNFRGSLYVSKLDAKTFVEKFILRSKLIKELQLSENEYQYFKKFLKIEEIVVTLRTIVIPISIYSLIKMIKFEYICVEEMADKLNVSAEKIFLLLTKYEIERIQINRNRVYLSLKSEEYINEILINDSFFKDEFILINEIYKNSRYSRIRKSPSALKRLHEAKLIELYTDLRDYTLVKLSSLEALVNLENRLDEEFISFNEAARLLNYRDNIQHCFKDRLSDFAKSNQISLVILEGSINQNTHFIHKEQLNGFLKNYTSKQEIIKKYPISVSTLHKVLRDYDIPSKSISNRLIYYPNDPLIKILEDKYPQVNPDDYYDRAKVIEILNLSKSCSSFTRFKSEEKLTKHLVEGFYRFQKKEIDKLKEKQEEYRRNYYCYSEAKKMVPHDKLVELFKEDRIKSTMLIKASFKERQNHGFIYAKKAIDTYALASQDRVDKNRLMDGINYSDPHYAFKRRLEINEIKAGYKNELTTQCWFDYCYRKIDSTEGNQITIINVVSSLSKCTEHIFKATERQELHRLSDNEINLRLFNHQIPLSHQKIMYSFLKDLEAQMKNLKIRITFNFTRIINPFNIFVTPADKSIYSFETYTDLYEYANLANFHKDKALEDAEKIINGSKAVYYASSWLYVLVHLNNAWRHADIVANIPRLNKRDIPSMELSWYRNNDLNQEQVKAIVNRLLRKEFIVSKTGAMVKFSCSGELMRSVATAAIICELITSQTKPASVGIIDFGVKKQDFTQTSKNAFFSNFVHSDFVFESRKFNRTLLSLTYMVLVKKGKTLAALEVAKRLRAHDDFESTNIYINISQEDMNKLTQQLFHRQHFGYIPNLLAELLMGEQLDRQLRTKQILLLNSKFQGIYGVEKFSGFLNTLQAEKKLISDRILSMGYEEAVDLLFKLDLGLMPSKQQNIQCLVSEEGCTKPGLDCKNCLFSIPNFYALSALADSLEKLLLNLRESFHSEFPAEKTRVLNRLYKQLDMLQDACNTFGVEEVMKFFKQGKEGFFELLEVLDELNMNEDIEKYLL